MHIEEYVEKMKNIEDKLLNFLDYEDNFEENYYLFMNILTEQNILTNNHDLKLIFYMINKISKNHHRSLNFFSKIEKILRTLTDQLKEYYTSKELFKIFKTSKRILLFLFEEKIINLDKSIYEKITSNKYKQMKYPEYFSPEIKPFLDSEIGAKGKPKGSKNHGNLADLYDEIENILKGDLTKFKEQRKKGEHEGYLERIIQEDLIEEFIIFVNKENYSLSSYVEKSIFETNAFLLKEKKTSLIEYASFYGSTQIFKYLYKNGVNLTQNLFYYAIHGSDAEIIHILEEKQKEKEYNSNFIQCLEECIKCHHNYITEYIINNSIYSNEFTDDKSLFGFKYYNFSSIQFKEIDDDFINAACKYDYYTIVEYLIKTKQMYMAIINICINFFIMMKF